MRFRRTAGALAAAALTIASGASAQLHIARVPWDGRTHGGAQFVPDGNIVWVLSGTLTGSNVWRIDPGAAAPKRVSIPTMRDLVAGHGQLWAVSQEGAGRPRLYFVDVRDGYRLHEKKLPQGCGRIGHGHLVYGGRLWFFCDFDHVAVFDPKAATPVKRLSVDGDLIEGASSLWRLDLHYVLRCVAGPCKGRGFPIGTTGSWDTNGDFGWIYRKGAPGREGLLTIVQFRQRAMYDGFLVKVPPKFSSVADLRIVGDEIWVQDFPKFRLLRYRINDPLASPQLLQLPGVSKSAESSTPPAVAAGRVWVSVRDGDAFKIFRLAVPRDPLPLRRIRGALMQSKGRLGPGSPLHVSCERSKKRFRLSLTFNCDVRFPKTTKVFCVAIVNGRLAVDATHAACRS